MELIASKVPAGTIYCPRCKRPILRQHVDWDKNTAFCDGCNLEFTTDVAVDRQREEVVIPPGFTCVRLTIARKELDIIIKWAYGQSIFEFFGAPYNPGSASETVLMQVGAISAVTTEIRVDPNFFRIAHEMKGDLPSAFFQSQSIAQVFVRKLKKWYRPGFFAPQYVLYLRLKDGSEYDIFWGLPLNALLYLEQEIERILGIEDKAMAEEIV